MTNRHLTDPKQQPLGPATPKPEPPPAAEPKWEPMPEHPKIYEIRTVDGRLQVRVKGGP